MSGLQWWCSAAGGAWSWSWRPYPGVWLFVLALAAMGLALRRRAGRVGQGAAGSECVPGSGAESGARPEGRPGGAARAAFFAAGIAVLWIGLDWPLGPLGAGYLASAHMLQYLLIALVAPALLLLGVPKQAYAGNPRSGAAATILRFVTHPLAALAIFNVILVWTHLPAVVDGLMRSQGGSFLLDTLWLAGGLVFWWPVLAPVPRRPRFTPPLQMGYLFAATVLNTMPYAFLTFGELPFYGIYELAPRVAGVTARQDQQIAGLLMKVGGGVILWSAITIVFFRWWNREGDPASVPSRI